MKLIFDGITYDIKNIKKGSEIAKVTADWIILEVLKLITSSSLTSIFALDLEMYTVIAPIPSPKNATDIAIKA